MARLRYETFDARGEHLDQWQIRALVPRLPEFGGQAATAHPLLRRMECPSECRAELARSNGTQLARSGEASIAAEWVLRMPVGQTFDLGPRTLVTQDIFASGPSRLAITSRREGGRQILEPANVRVTLVHVCPADVRVGTITRLEFHPHATVPIPRGFRTMSWVQLDGCASLLGPGVP